MKKKIQPVYLRFSISLSVFSASSRILAEILPEAPNSTSLIALASSVTPDPAIQKSAALEKAATPTPSAKPFADRVYIMKSNLPASIKKNDVIDVDGIKYRCTCDDGGKLSERGEGDRWLLTMEPDAKEDAVAAPSY